MIGSRCPNRSSRWSRSWCSQCPLRVELALRLLGLIEITVELDEGLIWISIFQLLWGESNRIDWITCNSSFCSITNQFDPIKWSISEGRIRWFDVFVEWLLRGSISLWVCISISVHAVSILYCVDIRVVVLVAVISKLESRLTGRNARSLFGSGNCAIIKHHAGITQFNAPIHISIL